MRIPTTLVMDDFYSDPDGVVALANSLPYAKAPRTNYPGERTGELAEVAPDFFAEWREMFLSLFGGCNPNGDDAWTFSTRFQRIPGVSNEGLNEGWVHADMSDDIAGVIYLNDQSSMSTGTTIVQPKTGLRPDLNSHIGFRNSFYGGRNQVTEEDYIAAKANHNRRFDDDLKVASSFNRMFAFNCKRPHKQNGFGGPDDLRLTQVFFARMKG